MFGIYTPISAEVGINRSMVMNPKMRGTRGEVIPFDLDKADATNLFSIGELLNVFTPTHADSTRSMMATVQGKHLTPTKIQHPYIVGNGSDKALASIIGQDFKFSAILDGKIKKIDKKNNVCILEYSDGSTSVIDTSSKPAKNSGGGFFIQNKLDLNEDLKEGSKFKRGEILAKDVNFFRDMLDGSVGFAGGCISKVAVISQAETFEDSATVTRKLVEDMSSEIVSTRTIVLDTNTSLVQFAKIGDIVDTNDALMTMERLGDDPEATEAALAKLDISEQELIDQMSKNRARAKYAGEIVDMRIYYNCDLEDLNPTVRELVNDYNKKHNARAKIFSSARKDEFTVVPSTSKINSDKMQGRVMSGVIVEYFIKHTDMLQVGDKITFAVALKSIIAETIEPGKEPTSEFRPDEEVSAFVSPMSIVSRMVPDVFLWGYSNKLIIELERACIDLLEE